MAIVDRTTTTTEIGLLYLDNCGYMEDGSVAMAKRLITIITAMLSRGLTVFEHSGERMEFSQRDQRAEIDRATRYVTANAGIAAGGRGVHHTDFREFRR